MKGEKYISCKKEKDGQKSKVERKSRQLGKSCDSKKCQNSKSKRQCHLIGEEDRQQLFQRFWFEMDWKQGKTLLLQQWLRNLKQNRRLLNKNQEDKQRSLITYELVKIYLQSVRNYSFQL